MCVSASHTHRQCHYTEHDNCSFLLCYVRLIISQSGFHKIWTVNCRGRVDVLCLCALSDESLLSPPLRIQAALPSADRCPHTGLLHSQLYHHTNEEQQEPREQCEKHRQHAVTTSLVIPTSETGSRIKFSCPHGTFMPLSQCIVDMWKSSWSSDAVLMWMCCGTFRYGTCLWHIF